MMINADPLIISISISYIYLTNHEITVTGMEYMYNVY